jgi:SAM-dependent methyltransferase
VVCVFGVFFVPDRVGLVRELWRLVKPGGLLAVTTWARDVFSPLNTAYWSAVESVRPELAGGFAPWDDLVEPEQVRSLLERAGTTNVTVELEEGEQELDGPDDAWAIVLGTGFRGTLDKLDAGDRERVRTQTFEAMQDVTRVRASAIYGAARRRPR